MLQLGDGNIVIQKAQGFSFLPVDFMPSHGNRYVAPPLSATTTDSDGFNKHQVQIIVQSEPLAINTIVLLRSSRNSSYIFTKEPYTQSFARCLFHDNKVLSCLSRKAPYPNIW